MESKKKTMRSLRIFGLLLHKCWLVCKRHWFTSLIGEFLIPMSLILGAWAASYYFKAAADVESEIHDESRTIMYAPSNFFTDTLMMKVHECLKKPANISGFDTESELTAYYTNENTRRIMAIIFDESTYESTKHLHYKIRTKQMQLNNSFDGFLQTQICLDQSYIQVKSNITTADISRVFIQRMLRSAYTTPTENNLLRKTFIVCLVVSFTIPLFIEASKATKEKFVGINVLMSMNGISNTSNLLSWVISGLLLLSALCAISVLFLTVLPIGDSLPFLKYGNPQILLVILILHLGHSLAFVLQLSAHCSKSFHLTYILIIITTLVTVWRYLVFDIVHHCLMPYVGMIFPIIMLYLAMDEIDTYEDIGIGIQWNNLFVNAIPDTRNGGTIGKIMVLSTVGAFIHFSIAIYMYTINPGKYGIGKHPLFFLMCKKKEEDDNDVKNFELDDEKSKYFESTSTKFYTPGIQIRNLRKSYDISLFNKEKVHALRGVSIDFYKGQITSILGHNGAGKSTLMSILTGMVSSTEGSILIDSMNMKDNACEILKDIGFCAQKELYFPSLSVKEQLEFFAMVKKDECRYEIESNVISLIQKLKLFDVKDCLPNKLSKDQKRKLCLGMAFVGNPRTLVLDEPTSRLDHENKRVIWDILLEMRGQKTILISTHDMEEADILGDRIAIMHEGRLKSYGTPLFLKKMIAGQSDIEITLSIERWSDSDKIRSELHSQASIIEKQDEKIIVRVPISSALPKSFKNLEEKKKDLGVTAYKLAHVGLEQVFLKVAEESDSQTNQCEAITSNRVKLKGFANYVQMIRALFVKKLNYAIKDSTTLLVQVFTVFLALLGTSIVSTASEYKIDSNANLDIGLLQQVQGNGPLPANSLDSETNLFSSAVMNLLGANYSVNISGELPSNTQTNVKELTKVLGHLTAVMLAISIYLAIAMFAIQPIRESAKGLKQLQMMTGVSGFTYWATMFLSDLTHYAILVVLLIVGLVCMDYLLELRLYGTTEIMIMVLLMMLLAINVLPLVYSFSFINAKTSFVLKLFTFIPIGIVILDCIVFVWKYNYNLNQQQCSITRVLYLLLPHVSFLHGQMHLHMNGLLNAICRRSSDEFYESQCKVTDGLCCDKDCRDRKCQRLIPYFLDNDVDSLRMNIIYLCVMPIVYFSILAVLESKIIQNVVAKRGKQSFEQPSLDKQLQLEKSIIFQKIQTIKENEAKNFEIQFEKSSSSELFLAYELRKHYRKVRAVEDVSLRVKSGECFGIFGANRSGKSTTFRMMTGGEVPDHGAMYLGDKDFKNDRKKIRYCPQYDATLKCLNSYDHLRLFARLRGIPEEHVENEVQAWIDKLNLNACASQPSGTLSSGNNQRLNIAMALVGNPNMVLLDEPTTRMDPGARRSFWRTVKCCQTAGQTFILASHNMEECEALCERTVIMVDGKLLCIGTPEELKHRFGAGYDVQIRMNSAKVKNQLDRIKNDMRLLLYCVLTNENSGYLMYHVIGAGTTWRKIYEVMNKIKSNYDCIDDFLVVVRLTT